MGIKGGVKFIALMAASAALVKVLIEDKKNKEETVDVSKNTDVEE